MSNKLSSSEYEQQLLEDICSFKYDPVGFVKYAFPWGEKNSLLEKIPGPRKWQMEELEALKEHCQHVKFCEEMGLPSNVYNVAVSSGRGPGKSALTAMLNLWMISCWIGCTCIVTANTEAQLSSKTMMEMKRWMNMMVHKHWFESTATKITVNKQFGKLMSEQLRIDSGYYYIHAQTWNEESPDAFAGAHSPIGMMVTFDEASGIPGNIWDVTEGFFTDNSPMRIWTVMSNPRSPAGRFYDCFHKDSQFWRTRTIDARTVEGLDTQHMENIIRKHGIDSFQARVEVMGLFPITGESQFISTDSVIDAQCRPLPDRAVINQEPLLMGVDVARFGDDKSVLYFRRGRDARSIAPVSFKSLDTMQLADQVAETIRRYKPDQVFVDGGGVGGGVVDRLRQLGFAVIEVQSGSSASDKSKYLNKRVEMWARMRDWLEEGCLYKDESIRDEMTAVQYEITGKGQLKLESKADMKKRGIDSPDFSDSLSLTFARNTASKGIGASARNVIERLKIVTDYDVSDFY